MAPEPNGLRERVARLETKMALIAYVGTVVCSIIAGALALVIAGVIGR